MCDLFFSLTYATFTDYYELDFAILKFKERKTFVTSRYSRKLYTVLNNKKYRDIFVNKLIFNQYFSNTAGRDFLQRKWADVRELGPDELRDFCKEAGCIVIKPPCGNSGYGIQKLLYKSDLDFEQIYDELISSGLFLVEEQIKQCEYMMQICPGTVHTTRINAYWDGRKAYILSWAQKFGMGAVSDQYTSGGFYAILDQNGHTGTVGYSGAHLNTYRLHPVSGFDISTFSIPYLKDTLELIEEAAAVVPQVPYVGWDVAYAESGPVIVEGNYSPGVYENKPSATGIRTGSRLRFREVLHL